MSSTTPGPETTPSTAPDELLVLPDTMTAAVTRSYGTPEIVALEELPVPSPGKGELLVKVEGSSLNALDWHFLTGTPYLLRLVNGLRRPKRIVPGADVAGIVVGVGAQVTDFVLGDEVFGECEGGGCAPYLTVDAGNVVAKPGGVSFETAGATPIAGLTALQGLRTKANVQPGDRVLINGSAGGVGTFAVQIAKALGAEVTAVCSARNVDMVRALGADEVIDYTSEDFAEGGARFDVMLDNVGSRTPAECLSVLKPDGRYVSVGGPKDNNWIEPMRYVARMWFACKRSTQAFHQFVAKPDKDDLEFLGALLASGELKPEIQRVIGIDGVADALAELGSGHARAKIAIHHEQG
ncbi:MAG: NADPH:quinone reductase-like Zn-dependent oxidoreductase [Verrucomicrobiales bacterium]|jgi:NADPH:quinone reductase-like Zn-dependent oxidoreductase